MFCNDFVKNCLVLICLISFKAYDYIIKNNGVSRALPYPYLAMVKAYLLINTKLN